MKNKGIVFCILFILCLGVFVTVNTRRFVSDGAAKSTAPETFRSSILPEFKRDVPVKQEVQAAGGEQAQVHAGSYSADLQAAQEAPVEVSGESAVPYDLPSELPAEAQAAEAEAELMAGDTQALPAPASRMMPEAGRAAAEEETAPVLISPLTGSKESGGAGSPLNKGVDYEKRLQDLDTQIKNMKASEVEPNTDSYKNMADYEYRQWDSELNAIYQDVLKNMSTEEVDALRSEEREWIKQRDITAYKAISKSNGGTIESLEFTASLAASTRTRAYELLENYGEYLNSDTVE